uniref:Uncharacterized protein n=1 Tax=Arundo donax TaxID=35708 RepID=A0A0A8ZTX7_ARUDO
MLVLSVSNRLHCRILQTNIDDQIFKAPYKFLPEQFCNSMLNY